jgi:2-succinyl-5-enolpyruvyl-6-hydroxy-3-cyclohexene-1-carboxylate synthase
VALEVSVQATFCATIVDEWVCDGITDAVVCPGSRSTPLALALAERLQVHVRLDERSAGFYALGVAMATGRPVVVCVTSGTAAVELHPSVVEAHHARIPLIVCTADRPPELQDVGASQTIDQVGLFTTSTRWSSSPGVPTDDQRASWRPLAARAYSEAQQGPDGPGPVHLNLAFREPLTGDPDELPPRRTSTVTMARPSPTRLTEPLRGRGMLIAGGGACGDPEHLLALGQRLGWPVVADSRSGVRLEGTIAAADAIVRTEPPLPDCVVLLGDALLSKALGAYVSAAAAQGARVIAHDTWGRRTDPTRVVTEFHRGDTDEWLRAARDGSMPADAEWLASWQARERLAQAAIADTLGDGLSEPQVARHLVRHAAMTDATVLVAASMPMRDVEWYAPALPVPPAVLANRGVNGIDGVVSTAFGVAATGRRTFALMGDLTFLHDVSGLVNLSEAPCTLVVLDNAGGGIFSFLPQAASLEPERFEQLFGTPPTSDVAEVGRGFGLEVYEVTSLSQLDVALNQPAPALIRVRVPGRPENVALHDAINQAVGVALSSRSVTGSI